MTKGNRIQAALILALSLLVSASWASETYDAKVVGISDGDTITVLHDGIQTKVRLYGIDTPERRQAFGSKAKQFTSDQVFGKTVKVVPMDTDRYGRTVALIQPIDSSYANFDTFFNCVTVSALVDSIRSLTVIFDLSSLSEVLLNGSSLEERFAEIEMDCGTNVMKSTTDSVSNMHGFRSLVDLTEHPAFVSKLVTMNSMTLSQSN